MLKNLDFHISGSLPLSDYITRSVDLLGSDSVMLLHSPGNFPNLLEGLFNRLFSIRIDQTAGCR
jgi:hypothetical protein